MKLRVVHRYIHLDTAELVSGSVDAEISYRVNAATGALANTRQILKMGLGTRTNVKCIKLYVFSRLFYGVGAWPCMSEKNLNNIRKIYLHSFRLALRQNFDGVRDLLTNAELFAKFGIDTVKTLSLR